MKRALITGGCGQDGHYLIGELVGDYEVFALYRGQDEERYHRMRMQHPMATWIRGDVTDPASVLNAVALSRPDAVFNLAALSFVGLSWDQPHLYMETNAGGCLNVLEAVRKLAPGAHVVQASSSEMFGNAPVSPRGYSETSPMFPASPYGVSKLAAHGLCRVYRESFGMRVSSAISFNHESPRRPPAFVTRKVVQAAVAIANGSAQKLRLGNLRATRDWGFAGDYVKAYRLMAEQSRGEDYVIGTGVTHEVGDLVEQAFAAVGIEDWRKHVEVDEAALRPNDVRWLRADPSKIDALLGWRATTSFEELIRMMVRAESMTVMVAPV